MQKLMKLRHNPREFLTWKYIIKDLWLHWRGPCMNQWKKWLQVEFFYRITKDKWESLLQYPLKLQSNQWRNHKLKIKLQVFLSKKCHILRTRIHNQFFLDNFLLTFCIWYKVKRFQEEHKGMLIPNSHLNKLQCLLLIQFFYFLWTRL